jgi:UDP-N-acetylmuramoylalanine--D-glutamate ligase
VSTPAPVEDALAERSFLLVGMGVTNRAAARALVRRGRQVVLVDDGDAAALGSFAATLATEQPDASVEHVHAPAASALASLVGRVDAVVPTPGLPERHPLFEAAAAAGVAVLSEFDLAGAWDDRPVLAVTGTNGKTTVTTLVHEMLTASGRRSAAVGNTEVPLVAAIEEPSTEVFVVEASSFRLAHSRRFRPRVATWLNFAEDHLDVHLSVQAYHDAKARIWADQGPDDVAVANMDDPVVAAAVPRRPEGPRLVRYGLGTDHGRPELTEVGGELLGPDGASLVRTEELWSTLPHDRSNALAAAATALEGGADLVGVRAALRAFRGLAHRVQLVAEHAGVGWYDDSKATAPHATLAALAGFDSVVLVAGGRNKGLDLSSLGAAAERVRAVVGIGEAASDVVAAFPGTPGVVASSMGDAVQAAAELARAGDVVLLSPGCASFDWYGSYAERGDDFVDRVHALLAGATT